jgi:hypothetical protein
MLAQADLLTFTLWTSLLFFKWQKLIWSIT